MKTSAHVARDLSVLVASLALAWLIVVTDTVPRIAEALDGFAFLGFFVAGFFFTSFATVAPAGVALAGFAEYGSPILVALVGAVGSVIADVVLFRVSREHISMDMDALLRYPKARRLRAFLRMRSLRFFSIALGGLILASPIPDEVGVTLMGLSRMNPITFLCVAYLFNFLGILVIGVLVTGSLW